MGLWGGLLMIQDFMHDKLHFSDLDEFQKDALIEELLKKIATLEYSMNYKEEVQAYNPVYGRDY